MLLFLLCGAIAFGLMEAGKRLRTRYRGAYTNAGRHHRGRLACIASAIWHGTRPAWRECRDGFKEGWGEGKRRVRARWGDPPAPPIKVDSPKPKAKTTTTGGAEPAAHRDAAGSLYFGDDPADPNGVKQCPVCQGRGVVNGEPCPSCQLRQRARDLDAAATRRAAANQPPPSPAPLRLVRPQETAMSIGEIRTIADARRVLIEFRDRAVADMEDATAEANRARAELAIATNLGDAATVVFDRDPAARSAIAGLSAPAIAASTAAAARVSAATQKVELANAALAAAAKHSAMEEATAATGQASTSTSVYAAQ